MTILSQFTGAISTAFSGKVSVARPANSTAYAVGDVVGAAAAAFEVPFVGAPNSQVIITDVDLRVDVAGIPAGMSSFRLHLYNAAPASALADNAAWDLTVADREAYLGYVDIETPTDAGATLYAQNSVNKQIKMGGSSNLWAYLVTNGAYTPTSAAVKTVRIHTLGVS